MTKKNKNSSKPITGLVYCLYVARRLNNFWVAIFSSVGWFWFPAEQSNVPGTLTIRFLSIHRKRGRRSNRFVFPPFSAFCRNSTRIPVSETIIIGGKERKLGNMGDQLTTHAQENERRTLVIYMTSGQFLRLGLFEWMEFFCPAQEERRGEQNNASDSREKKKITPIAPA